MRGLVSIAVISWAFQASSADAPFSFHVFSGARGDPEVVALIDEGLAELEKELGERTGWFGPSETEGDAELVVELKAYCALEDMDFPG